MVFDGTVSGAGTFTVGSGSSMEINDNSTALTGNVVVDGGELKINQDFTTTGALTLKSLGNLGTILVAVNKVAFFDK